jgi:two-component system response regulator PilR (NtrC family)
MGADILVVDDDEILGTILVRVLQRQGHQVFHATGLESAQRLARERSPQLALVDLCLRDADGREVARRLREMVGELPCILMTAYPLRLRDHPELNRDFVRVLFKPLDLIELRNAIADALEPSAPRMMKVS